MFYLSWAMQVDCILEGVFGSEVGDGDVSISGDQKTSILVIFAVFILTT